MKAKISNPSRSLTPPKTTTKKAIITPKRIRRNPHNLPNHNPRKHPHPLKPRVLKLVNPKSRHQSLRKIPPLKRRNQMPRKLVPPNPKSRKKPSQ